MKITEIDWTAGKKYKDQNEFIWEVKPINGGKQHILVDEDKWSLIYVYAESELATLEFEKFPEESERKYYLKLNKPYVREGFNYLQYKFGTGKLCLGNNTDCEDDKSIPIKSKFTNKEIKSYVDIFGAAILDFDKVPVEEVDDD